MEVRDRHIRIAGTPGGLSLRVREWPGGVRPLVLVHGLASNARIWDAVSPSLAGRFRVVECDVRGHGLSD